MTSTATNVAEIAHRFTDFLRRGAFAAAGAQFRADDMRSVRPRDRAESIPALIAGFAGAEGQKSGWFATHGLNDLAIDGPFVTGDQFALFLDVLIINRTSGAATPFTEIAVFTVSDGRISEERYFYD